jgi:hypothetical protein
VLRVTIATVTPKEQGGLQEPEVDVLLPSSDDAREDQPDPVTLSHPSFDGNGLLRWASATFDLPH